jgi:hypothetical protein
VELTLFITTPYWADNPGKHPHYLHALPDLRDARVHLERRDTDPVDHADEQTIEMIDVAMADIRRAPRLMTERTFMITSRSTSDSRAYRFHKAIELLAQAKQDVAEEEDQADTRGVMATSSRPSRSCA